MLKKLKFIVILLFSINFLQSIPVKAESPEPVDYFLVTNANKKLTEYYYYLNGSYHHIPADFSLTNVSLYQDSYFVIEGDYYIKNDMPLKIKLGAEAKIYTLSSSTLYVIGVDDEKNPQQYCLATEQGKVSVFTYEELESFLYDSDLKVGDILKARQLILDFEHNQFTIRRNSRQDLNFLPQDIIVSGSLLNSPVIQEFTVYSKHEESVVIKNRNGKKFTIYPVPENFITFPAPDFSSLKRNQTVFCITENGVPLALYNTEIKPNGDADGNQETDILDVIQVNQAILGKGTISPERIPYIDFNHNGIPDSSDSLSILKFIVGLI